MGPVGRSWLPIAQASALVPGGGLQPVDIKEQSMCTMLWCSMSNQLMGIGAKLNASKNSALRVALDSALGIR